MGSDSVSDAIAKHALLLLQSKVEQNGATFPFEFHEIAEDAMVKEILALDPSKSVSGPISVKALRIAAKECAGPLTSIFNSSIVGQYCFPDELKLADIH